MLEMEEHLLAAYLKFYQNCERILRTKELLVDNFNERWCLGINGVEKKIFFCKVTVAPSGIIQKLTFGRDLREQYEKAKEYAEETFPQYKFCFMLWIDKIPFGILLRQLLMLEEDLEGSFELIINQEYTRWMNKIYKYFYNTGQDQPNLRRIIELYGSERLYKDRGSSEAAA